MPKSAGKLVLLCALAMAHVVYAPPAGAQTPRSPTEAARPECDGRRPTHEFRRVTSDSLVVRPLENARADLANLVIVDPTPHVPRDRLDYDVVLDVPRLCLEQLRLRVDSLTARVSIDADIASLVRVTAGAGVAVGHVDLYLEGVRATALLAVDLTDVKRAVDVVMTYLDAHPEVLKRIWRQRIVDGSRRR